MKIVVDEIPEKSEECLLRTEWDHRHGMVCRILHQPCYLDKNIACPYLKEQQRRASDG